MDLARTLEKFESLKALLKRGSKLLIVTHKNPDPDSLASAFALKFLCAGALGVKAQVRYTGMVGRPENREMVRLLKLKIDTLSKTDLTEGSPIALVDCQPHTGNVDLPRGTRPLIVIDHHPARKTTRPEFLDVRRDYGATATILAEYLIASGLEIPSWLATALCYAIISETQNLGRGATVFDTETYSILFNRAGKKCLSQIQNPKLPRDYFITLSRALHHAAVYKNVVISNLGEIEVPDFVAYVADLLLKNERISWSMCTGRHENRILVSIRTSQKNKNAGAFLRRLVGKRGTAGGHEMMAGGQIGCASTSDLSCDQIEKDLKTKFLKHLGYDEDVETTPLLIEQPS